MEQKKNKIKSLLQQCLSECGEDKELKQIKITIEEMIAELGGKNVNNSQMSQMLDSSKKNQDKWWNAVKAGMKSFKKDKK